LSDGERARQKIPWPQILQGLIAAGLLGGTNATTALFSRSTPDQACAEHVREEREECHAQAFDTLRRCIELTGGD
jgi:hypothetical protein